MFKNLIMLFFTSLLVISCSSSSKKPGTDKKYKVNVGGWSDMEKYNQARENVMSPEKTDEALEPVERSQECNVVDCPDSVREGRPF
ncbi:MAG: hypothetical protein ACN4GM_06915 [Gammaproteobacteria bacterium]